jgi:hypothetical protein
VVVAYEQVFFNVRDGLACSDWVAAHCLGPRSFTELREDDVDLIMAWFGYAYGSDALDLLIDAVYGGSPGGRAGDGSEDTELAEGLRGAVALLALPKDSSWGRMVLELAARQEWLDLEHADGCGGPVTGPIVAGTPVLDLLASGTAARPSIVASGLDIVAEMAGDPAVPVSKTRAGGFELELEREGPRQRMA